MSIKIICHTQNHQLNMSIKSVLMVRIGQLIFCHLIGEDFQKSAFLTLLQLVRIRAAHQALVCSHVFNLILLVNNSVCSQSRCCNFRFLMENGNQQNKKELATYFSNSLNTRLLARLDYNFSHSTKKTVLNSDQLYIYIFFKL